MDIVLGEREKAILRTLIRNYIVTAEPVGSRTISKHLPLNLSPATIRNIMADLEEIGLVWQPHTSAGRVPTEKAFRFYVDFLLEEARLRKRDRDRIRDYYVPPPREAEELLRETARVLSAASEYVGVVVAPGLSMGALKHIHFTRLDDQRVLVILASQMGMIQHRLIQNSDQLSQEELNKASRYLNSELSGLTLMEMRQKIWERMQEEKSQFDTLVKLALALGEQALAESGGGQVYVEGKLNILDQAEFADLEKIKAIFKAFEEKNKILKLLDKSMKARGLNIFIGSENELQEIQDLSLVTSSLMKGHQILGTLGVIGPTRMDYSKVISVVRYVSEVVNQLLEEGGD